MNPHPIVGLVTVLTAADPAGCTRTEIAELASQSAQVRSWLDAFDATLAAASPDPTVVNSGGRRSSREANTIAARGQVCADMPELHDALASGTVAAGHVDAVARVAGQVEESVRAQLVEQAAELVEKASVSSVDWFERHVRDLARRLSADDGLAWRERIRRQRFLHRWTDHQTGLCHTHLALDPEADARVSAVLDAAVADERAKPDPEARTFDQLRADAFVAAFTGPRSGGRRPAEVTVLIDAATFTGGSHEQQCARRSTANPSHRSRCGGSPVTPSSSRSSSTPPGSCCTTATAGAWPPSSNAERYGPCTAAAGSLTARCGSGTATSITSSNGCNTVGRPTSTTCSPVQPAPPPRPRRWLAPPPVPRPAPRRAPPRRHHHVRRHDRRRGPRRQRPGRLSLGSTHRATRPAGAAVRRRHRSPLPFQWVARPAGAALPRRDWSPFWHSEYVVRLASALDYSDPATDAARVSPIVIRVPTAGFHRTTYSDVPHSRASSPSRALHHRAPPVALVDAIGGCCGASETWSPFWHPDAACFDCRLPPNQILGCARPLTSPTSRALLRRAPPAFVARRVLRPVGGCGGSRSAPLDGLAGVR